MSISLEAFHNVAKAVYEFALSEETEIINGHTFNVYTMHLGDSDENENRFVELVCTPLDDPENWFARVYSTVDGQRRLIAEHDPDFGAFMEFNDDPPEDRARAVLMFLRQQIMEEALETAIEMEGMSAEI